MLNKVQPTHIIGQGTARTQNGEGQGTAHIFWPRYSTQKSGKLQPHKLTKETPPVRSEATWCSHILTKGQRSEDIGQGKATYSTGQGIDHNYGQGAAHIFWSRYSNQKTGAKL